MERSSVAVLLPLVLIVVSAFAVSFAGEEPVEPESETAELQDVTPPLIILGTQKAPVFPPAALAARFSGVVTVQITVDLEGKLGDVKAIECSHPNVGFEKAAIDAVKKWRFEPAMKEGEPVEFTTTFRLNFHSDRREPYVTASGIPSLAGDERPSSAHRAGSASTAVDPGARPGAKR